MHIVIDAHVAVQKIDGVSSYLNGPLAELPKIDWSVQYTILSLPARKCSCLKSFLHMRTSTVSN